MITINKQNISPQKYSEECEYFEFRLKQENQHRMLKEKHSKTKKQSVNIIKKLEGVSLSRLNKSITLVKKLNYLSVQERTNKSYDLLIQYMERSFVRHYESSESVIKDYFNTIYTLHDDMSKFRKVKKKEFNEYKKELVEKGFSPSVLNLAYIEFKNVINYIKKENISIDEYNSRIKKYEHLNDITNQFILYEYNKIIEEKHKKIKIAKEKEDQLKKYEQAMIDVFGSPNISSTEAFVTDIINN